MSIGLRPDQYPLNDKGIASPAWHSKLETMKRRKTDGCGKLLNAGERAVYLWGLYLCPDCDKKHHHPFMAVYTEGVLAKPTKCGMTI